MRQFRRTEFGPIHSHEHPTQLISPDAYPPGGLRAFRVAASVLSGMSGRDLSLFSPNCINYAGFELPISPAIPATERAGWAHALRSARMTPKRGPESSSGIGDATMTIKEDNGQSKAALWLLQLNFLMVS